MYVCIEYIPAGAPARPRRPPAPAPPAAGGYNLGVFKCAQTLNVQVQKSAHNRTVELVHAAGLLLRVAGAGSCQCARQLQGADRPGRLRSAERRRSATNRAPVISVAVRERAGERASGAHGEHAHARPCATSAAQVHLYCGRRSGSGNILVYGRAAEVTPVRVGTLPPGPFRTRLRSAYM